MEKILDDGRFKIVATHQPENLVVIFEVIEYSTVNPKNGKPEYRQEEKYMWGQVKWDGCMDVSFGKDEHHKHFCGFYDFKDTFKNLIEEVYLMAWIIFKDTDANTEGHNFPDEVISDDNRLRVESESAQYNARAVECNKKGVILAPVSVNGEVHQDEG